MRLQHYDANGAAAEADLATVLYSITVTVCQLRRWLPSITWHSNNQDGNSSWGVYARLMNADGTPRSGEFAVNTYTPGQQANAGVTHPVLS